MRTLGSLVLVVCLAAASGCTIYFGDDEPYGDDVCVPTPRPAPLLLLDPQSLSCFDYSYPQCDCGPCPVPAVEPPPTWGRCDSACMNLDETTCGLTSGCRIARATDCQGDQCGLTEFLGCYPVDTTGPIQGRCAGLDVWSCSQHDDCIALHDLFEARFTECVDEAPTPRGCYSDEECGPGARCTAIDECMPPPDCDPAVGCDDVCFGRCVPTCAGADEGTCIANPTCVPTYRGVDCTCDPAGCTCASQEFVDCQNAR